jgi:UDP-GlcNAc:undecaprenyl-phosphate GlcNAc-1-phosphate transferase
MPVFLALLLMGIFIAKLRVYPEQEFCLLRERSYSAILFDLTYKRQLLMVLLDFGLIAFSYYVSYRLRFSEDVFPYYFKVFLRSLPAVIVCKLTAFFVIGIYRGQWTSMGVSEVYTYFKACTLATVLSVTAVTYIYRFADFSKGIFLIDWLLTSALLLCTRGSFRVLDDAVKRRSLGGDRVLIYGAGRGGEILLRELLNNKNRRIKPVGFIDDDVFKVGKSLQGFPIVGTFANIDALIQKHPINGLLMSFDKKDPHTLEAIKEYCRKHGLFLKTFSVAIEDIDLEPNPAYDPCKSIET